MDLIITILPVVTKDLPISPRFTPYEFLSRCKFSNLTARQPMVEFYLTHVPTVSARPFFMANGKTKTKNCKNVEILWPKKTWGKIVPVGDPIVYYGMEKKNKKIAGSILGRPRRFLPPITPHKERCKYVHTAEYGSTG